MTDLDSKSEPARSLPSTVGPGWKPRSDDWLGREPSEFHGGPLRPIFIGACPRSGTTLLRSMLHNHPDFAMPGETNFVVPLWKARARFGDLRKPENRRRMGEWIFRKKGRGSERIRAGAFEVDEAIERIVAAPPTLGSVFEACFRIYADAHEKPRWGDKRPGYTGYLPMLFALFPDAQYINLVRDPRAAVASQMPLGWDEEGTELASSTATWETSIRKVDDYAPKLRPDQLLDVRYEDLVSDPHGTLERVCDWAGLRREGDTIEQMITKERTGSFREGWHERLSEPVTTAAVASWRQKLEPHEVAFVEDVTGGSFERFGYRREEGLDAKPRRESFEELERQRKRRRRKWRRYKRDELKRRLWLYRRPVAAIRPR